MNDKFLEMIKEHAFIGLKMSVILIVFLVLSVLFIILNFLIAKYIHLFLLILSVPVLGSVYVGVMDAANKWITYDWR